MEPRPYITADVYVSPTLVAEFGAWEFEPHLEALSIVTGCAPTIDTATLRYRFGLLDRENHGIADGGIAPRVPLELRGTFVRVVVQTSPLRYWYGYVVGEQRERGPAGEWLDVGGGVMPYLTDGAQIFTAVGLAWFLQRGTIHHSVVEKPTGGEQRIERAIAFNAGMGDGRSLDYELRANKDAAAPRFASSPDGAVEWTAADIVQYLLAEHAPQDDGGLAAPCAFALATSAVTLLDWYRPTIQTAGRSAWQVLADVISHARGLVWWLSAPDDVAGTLTVLLHVASMATAAVSLPGGATLPAAAVTLADPDLDSRDLAGHPLVTRDAGRRFDRVVVRGARRRAVFTVSPASGNLEPAWRAADETAYRTAIGADPVENDNFRRANRFEAVYAFFRIPPDWDGKSNDGSGPPGATAYACPAHPPGSTSILGAEPIHMPGLRLLRTMPLRVGWDYANATAPTPRDPADTSAEFQRPFAVVNANVSGSGGAQWRFTHEDGEIASAKETAYHLRPLDSIAGVQIAPGGGVNHLLALGHFDVEADGATEHAPQIDYAQLRVTVCGEWDAHCEGAWPAAIPTAAPVHTLFLDLGDRYRHDHLAAGTIYDVEADALKTVTTGGALRDDRQLCVQIARLAYEWYGVERAALRFTSFGVDLPSGYALGTLITTIGGGDLAETINATVSQIDYQLEAGMITVQCNFAELDFGGL